jgi:hypothetical protein
MIYFVIIRVVKNILIFHVGIVKKYCGCSLERANGMLHSSLLVLKRESINFTGDFWQRSVYQRVVKKNCSSVIV